jgi:hypothetical protein
MDYINTSHPSFVGGTKVVELAKHEVLPPKTSASLSGRKVLHIGLVPLQPKSCTLPFIFSCT